jgi:hypothetical protein
MGIESGAEPPHSKTLRAIRARVLDERPISMKAIEPGSCNRNSESEYFCVIAGAKISKSILAGVFASLSSLLPPVQLNCRG